MLSLVLAGCESASTESSPTTNPSSTSTFSTVLASPSDRATPTPAPTPGPTAQIGRIIVIDPGHGGEDWGTFHSDAQDKPDLLEKDITLRLGLQTAELLRGQGYRVVLTREGDYSPNNPPRDLNGDAEIDENDDLQARIERANQSKADLFLSIHINSSELGNEVGGIETWYCADRPFAQQNKLFAQLIQKESIASLQANGYAVQNRRVEDDAVLEGSGEHLVVLGPVNQHRPVATEMPGVLTEALFISNDTEARLLTDSKTIKALAMGYTKAIDQYFHP